MHEALRNTAPIPLDWNPGDALLVADFLQEIIDTIWIVHGDSMDRILHARKHAQCQLDLGGMNAPERLP